MRNEKLEIMETKLLNGEMLEFTNGNQDDITIWFNSKWKTFNLMINAKVIKSTKTWKPIENKLNGVKGLKEVQSV